MRAIFRIAAFCAACMAALPVWEGPVWCAQNPQVLSSGVRSDRGAVAWSPDGKRIAYLKKRVEVYDIGTHITRVMKVANPFFVNWSSSGNLLILHGRKGHRELAVAKSSLRSVKSYPLGVEADGIYPLGEPDIVLMTVSNIGKSSDGGIPLIYKLFTVNIRNGSLVKRFERSLPLPVSDTGMLPLMGWMQGGLHPLDLSPVIFEFVHSSYHNPYMKLAIVAIDTGQEADIYRAQEGAVFVPSGSFSPVGRRLALATSEGRLRIYSFGGAMEAPDDSVEGFHPAWSPGGDWIYFGGVLVSQGKKRSRPLLERAARSIAAWCPDGNRLAVSSGGKLWLFDTSGLDTPAVPEPMLERMREKVKLLRDLLSEGFLDEEEYNIRYSSILSRYGY